MYLLYNQNNLFFSFVHLFIFNNVPTVVTVETWHATSLQKTTNQIPQLVVLQQVNVSVFSLPLQVKADNYYEDNSSRLELCSA